MILDYKLFVFKFHDMFLFNLFTWFTYTKKFLIFFSFRPLQNNENKISKKLFVILFQYERNRQNNTQIYPFLNKSQTAIGEDTSTVSIGIIPTAVAWLYKVIKDRKSRSNVRFSIRVSAVEIRNVLIL